jgi:hypothetical protein
MVNILYWSLHNLLLHFRMEVDTMFSTCDIVCKVIPAKVLLEVIQAVQQICSLPDKVFQSLYLHIANGRINFVPNHLPIMAKCIEIKWYFTLTHYNILK